ncbi:hypothetical protein G6F68_017609 [Rhizopus microsporus]|nr:hypothetical protein G6F68_017609 [Rhizopus microsporus]
MRVVSASLVLEDTGDARKTVDARIHQQTDLVDQVGLEESAVDGATAFQQDRVDAERGAQRFHRGSQILPLGTCEQIRHAICAQLAQVLVGHVFA